MTLSSEAIVESVARAITMAEDVEALMALKNAVVAARGK